jgi:hypothetical protein
VRQKEELLLHVVSQRELNGSILSACSVNSFSRYLAGCLSVHFLCFVRLFVSCSSHIVYTSCRIIAEVVKLAETFTLHRGTGSLYMTYTSSQLF